MNDLDHETAVPEQFAAAVCAALARYRDVAWLGSSPLASLPLARAGLVAAADQPAAADWGRAVQAVLAWGVTQLAPEPPRFPVGTVRPFDDPSWASRDWWPYNIMRHRYIEPVPRARRFVADGLIDTLLALTGIPSRKVWLRLRRQAQQDVAALIYESRQSPQEARDVERLAVRLLLLPFKKRHSALRVLGLAAAWRGDIPAVQLRRAADAEGLANIDANVALLLQQRIIGRRAADGALWLPRAVREHANALQPPAAARKRHALLAGLCRETGDLAEEAAHLQAAGQSAEAAAIVCASLAGSPRPLPLPVLRQTADAIDPGALPPGRLAQFGICRAWLLHHTGTVEEMLAACRAAAQSWPDQENAGRLSLLFGLAYLSSNYQLADVFFRDCARLVPPDHRDHLLALGNLAEIALEQDQPDRAAEFEDQLRFRAPNPDDAVRACAWRSLAAIAAVRGAVPDALQLIGGLLPLLRGLGWWPDAAECLALLTSLQAATGDPEARRTAGEADALASAMGLFRVRLSVLLSAGELDWQTGAFSAALDKWNEALRGSLEADHNRLALRARLSLARTAAHTGWSAAHEHWLGAFSLARELGAVREVTRLLADPMAPAGVETDSAFVHLPDRIALGLALRHGQVTPVELARAGKLRAGAAQAVLASLTDRQLMRRSDGGRASVYQLAAPQPPPGEAWPAPGERP